MNSVSNLFDYLKYHHKTGKLFCIKSRCKAKAGSELTSKNVLGYKTLVFFGKPYLQHRVCWFLYYGTWPKNNIDHINGKRDDNRIKNLRDVTQRENCSNRKSHREGKLIGTYYHKVDRCWEAIIQINKKRVYLGRSQTEIGAHEIYLKAVRKLRK